MNLENRLKGIYFGAVVGDVYGAPYEFESKDYMQHYESEYKHGEYSYGGPFNLPKGYYTDDTSMMLCLAQSLIDKRDIDMHDQALKYIEWFKNGYMSSTGECFDIGTQTCKALKFYSTNKEFMKIEGNKSSGNGALMRYAPIPIVFYHPTDKHNMTWKSIQQTQVTHDTFECIWLGNYFGYILSDLMNQHAVDKVRKKEYFTSYDILHYHFKNLFDDTYEAFGGGYVKDSVYIALESVLDSENFIDAIIKTIDYGQDTDTNACITGMLAGAYYGFDSIPKKLIEEIKDLELIEDIYNKLIDLRNEINAE